MEKRDMGQKTVNNLFNDLTAALERDPRIDIHHYPLRIRIQDQHVSLEGQVENIAAKKAAITQAKKLFGDKFVTDELRVTPAEHKEDGALRDAVITLYHEPALSEITLRLNINGGFSVVREVPGDDNDSMIDVRVTDGTVTLSGWVRSLTHKRLAEVLVWWTAGCESVDNQLEVTPPEEDNDQEITDAVRMVQEKDPFVHASQLAVNTSKGIVTLQGYVASKEEKKLAALDAWYVSGVQDVVDQIQTMS
jgi:osmotically-inducible protein OsmY